MMMTVNDQTNSSSSQSIDSASHSVANPSSMTTNYPYHHHLSWEKPNYAISSPSLSLFSMPLTGATSSMSNSLANFPNNNSTFYRRHTESTLSTSSNSFFPSISNISPFHYPTTESSDLYFGWSQNSSFVRTNSATYPNYGHIAGPVSSMPPLAPSMFVPNYPVMNSLPMSSGSDDKVTVNHRFPLNSSASGYSTFANLMQPNQFDSSLSSISTSYLPKTSTNLPSTRPRKRSRLTPHLRNEILRLKAQKSTIFVWEIQQILLQTGICTSQTVPSASVIQRVLSESAKSTAPIRDEMTSSVNLVEKNDLMKKTSPVTICLSPSPSSNDNDGESTSECSICLESYRSGQGVSILACSHEYHSSCIGEWMLKNRSCPMCRKDIHDQPQFVTLLI